MTNIATEEAAFGLLEQILSDNAIPSRVSFEGWPELLITLTGEQFKGTITPHVMRGLLDFQSSIYRSYATAKYGLPDARRLTEEEREELEISVHVEEGSSILAIDFEAIIEKLIEQVGGRMTPAELITLVIVLALIWSGKTLVSKFLNDRKEIALKKLDESGRAELVGALVALGQEDKRKLRIFASAINENSRIATAAAIAQDGQADLIKGMADADTVEIQGHTIAGEALRHMARNARRKAVDINLEGLYMIRRVDTSDPLMTRVKVQDISDR